MRGKGSDGDPGAAAGDLLIQVRVSRDPVFGRQGDDLTVTVPVTFAEAALGAQVDVPTLDADGAVSTVRVKVPAGTPSGRTLRVKGRGVKHAKGSGDLRVTVQVAVPQRLTDDARAAVEAYAKATAGEDPRADLMAQGARAAGPAADDERGGASWQARRASSTWTTSTPVFVISVAAQMAGMHPQTLRQYDRLGLVSPDRTRGRGRRYSARDVAMLRQVQRLSQDEGVSLAGIKAILELEHQVAALRARVAELTAELDAAQDAAGRRPPGLRRRAGR